MTSDPDNYTLRAQGDAVGLGTGLPLCGGPVAGTGGGDGEGRGRGVGEGRERGVLAGRVGRG